MDVTNLHRLLEEQKQALDENDRKVDQWNRFQTDYTALQTRLETLPAKTTHNVMVPLGRLAFMPGQLVHTNEITVLLGDNYFLERSASQAADIVLRRLQDVNRTIKGLLQEKEILIPRHDFASEMIDLAQGNSEQREIIEPYDEDEDKIWRERHRKFIQPSAICRQKARRPDNDGSELDCCWDAFDRELWVKLDRLQVQEEQGREMERSADVVTAMESFGAKCMSGNVVDTLLSPGNASWHSSKSADGSFCNDLDDHNDKAILVKASCRFITIKHTKTGDMMPSLAGDRIEGTCSRTINSPADIASKLSVVPKSTFSTVCCSSQSNDSDCANPAGTAAARDMSVSFIDDTVSRTYALNGEQITSEPCRPKLNEGGDVRLQTSHRLFNAADGGHQHRISDMVDTEGMITQPFGTTVRERPDHGGTDIIPPTVHHVCTSSKPNTQSPDNPSCSMSSFRASRQWTQDAADGVG